MQCCTAFLVFGFFWERVMFLRKTAVLLATVLTVHTAKGQDLAIADSSQVWRPALIGMVSGSQVGFQNWAEGGVNTLAFSLAVDGQLERSSPAWAQSHDLRLTFGLVKQDTLDFRKSDDLIRLVSSLDYTGEGIFGDLRPTFAFQARSQFSPGFNFDKNPFKDGRTPPVKVSDFLSPGTFILSIGLTYVRSTRFRQRLGFGAKETVVLIERLRRRYGVEPEQKARFEVGIEGFTEVDLELVKNVRYKSTLGLFIAFNKPGKPDLLWESMIVMKVNSWLSVNFDWVLQYDTDVSSKAQLKEVFSIGVFYIII